MNPTLNHILASAGICSRRKAADLIKEGAVAVNGVTIQEPGYRPTDADKITVNGMAIAQEKKAYILLRKPAGYITTLADEQGRPTVTSLLKNVRQRVVPVGRLDQFTTGVLLLTNDGELAHQLAHPKYGIQKEYHCVLDQELRYEDREAIAAGIVLSDGAIRVDSIFQPSSGSRRKVSVILHSGRNRIVRRIFAHLGYNVVKLNRTKFGSLSYRGLKEGQYRHLTSQEIESLRITAAAIPAPMKRRPSDDKPKKARSPQIKSHQSGLKTRRGQVKGR